MIDFLKRLFGRDPETTRFLKLTGMVLIMWAGVFGFVLAVYGYLYGDPARLVIGATFFAVWINAINNEKNKEGFK